MTDPFLGSLKAQLTTGRRRLRRRRRTVALSVLVLALVGSVALVLASVDRNDVSIRVSSDGGAPSSPTESSVVPSSVTGTSGAIEPGPTFDTWQASQAERTLRSFLAAIRDDTDAAAAGLLSDYAVVTSDAGDGVAAVERFRTENEWALHPVAVQMTVTPSFSWGEPNPVVTVVERSREGDVEHAMAFVVARDDDEDASTLPLIVRLPDPEPTIASPKVTTPNGAVVSPGDSVFVAGLPVEGGATAYIDGAEVPVAVDDGAGGVRVTIPEVRRGDLVLTVSLATPEEPTARAVWFKVA